MGGECYSSGPLPNVSLALIFSCPASPQKDSSMCALVQNTPRKPRPLEDSTNVPTEKVHCFTGIQVIDPDTREWEASELVRSHPLLSHVKSDASDQDIKKILREARTTVLQWNLVAAGKKRTRDTSGKRPATQMGIMQGSQRNTSMRN